jgi:undecaprenyl-diphosphatase
MLAGLIDFDFALFNLINQGFSNAVFDYILPLFRNKLFWLPLYILILGYLLYKLKLKAVQFIVLIVLTVFISDKVSSELIKKTVCRTRPCNESTLENKIILRVDCGNAYSFTSTHAANHFALAHLFFLIVTPLLTGRKSKKTIWGVVFYFWAFSIAFAQVYVGVHYPTDVLFGALVGLSLASLTFGLFKLLIKSIL